MNPVDERFSKLDNPGRISYLIGCIITGDLSIEERDELDAWVVADEANMRLFEDMTDKSTIDKFLQWLTTRDTEGKLVDAKKRLNFRRKGAVVRWWHYGSAACVLGIIGFAIYFLWPTKRDEIPAQVQSEQPDILPGAQYAELLLPSGKVIRLDGLSDTLVGSIQIKGGSIEYGKNVADTLMHEIRIPRKGSYQLVLPDRSRVWLNAESSIRYPGAFAKNSREVTVTGETYFEIAKDAQKPFIVTTNEITIEALGTAFNINGFEKRITLIEGSVKVTGQNKKKVLKPGEQLETGEWKVSRTDTGPVIAWTKNQFKFKNATIEEVMKPVERWYDALIVYEDRVSEHFNGTIDRSVPVSKVLELLEETGKVHFTIEGNTIKVKK